jgi:hypothetical protein
MTTCPQDKNNVGGGSPGLQPLNVAASPSQNYDCNMYVLDGEDESGAWGYITKCGTTTCRDGYESVGVCNGKDITAYNFIQIKSVTLAYGCDSLCRKPGSVGTTNLYCDGTRTLCKKKDMTYTAAKNKDKLFDCCLTKEKGVIKGLDCPLSYCEDSTKCKQYMTDYCKTNGLESERCQKLKNDNKELYDEIAMEYCMKKSEDNEKEYPNMISPACNQWCIENKDTCAAVLPFFCENKYTGLLEDLQKYNATCGCFYPASTYTAFYAEIEQKYDMPPGFAQQKPICNHPFCATATVKDGDISTCKSYNIMQCFQNSTFVNKGNITGNINVDSSCEGSFDKLKRVSSSSSTPTNSACTITADCNNNSLECKDKKCVLKGCTSDSDCSSHMICKSGSCVTKTKCKSNYECVTGSNCIAGTCVKQEPPKEDTSLIKGISNTALIGGVVVVIVAIIIIAIIASKN